MRDEIKEFMEMYPDEVKALFSELREIIFEASKAHASERIWAKLPSYYVGEKFVRLIPFKDHINIEAVAAVEHINELKDYKFTPRGMLQVSVKQELPKEILLKIFAETLNNE